MSRAEVALFGLFQTFGLAAFFGLATCLTPRPRIAAGIAAWRMDFFGGPNLRLAARRFARGYLVRLRRALRRIWIALHCPETRMCTLKMVVFTLVSL